MKTIVLLESRPRTLTNSLRGCVYVPSSRGCLGRFPYYFLTLPFLSQYFIFIKGFKQPATPGITNCNWTSHPESSFRSFLVTAVGPKIAPLSSAARSRKDVQHRLDLLTLHVARLSSLAASEGDRWRPKDFVGLKSLGLSAGFSP